MLKKICILFLLCSLIPVSFAESKKFNCPQSFEITSTDFTVPSIWVAPAVGHAAHGTVGLGLGGKAAKEFLGAEAARIGNKPGWVCVYRSEGGMSVNEYQAAIIKEAQSISYLGKYIKKINKEFEKAEPYLKKFPKDVPLGFIGYQQEEK